MLNPPLALGETVPLRLQLSDGATGMFPRAFVYDASDALVATKNLTHVAKGRYKDDSFVMPSTAYVSAVYVVYSDAGYTTLASYDCDNDEWKLDGGFIAGAVIAGTLTVSAFTTSLTPTNTDQHKDAWIEFLEGPAKSSAKKIGAVTTGGLITLASGYTLPAAPVATNKFRIITH